VKRLGKNVGKSQSFTCSKSKYKAREGMGLTWNSKTNKGIEEIHFKHGKIGV